MSKNQQLTGEILQALTDGDITEDQARQQLIGLGFHPEDATDILHIQGGGSDVVKQPQQ